MQVTRKNRGASRRFCRLINRDKVDLLDQRADLKKWLAALQEGGKVAIDCDCWDNRATNVPAIPAAVDRRSARGGGRCHVNLDMRSSGVDGLA